MAARTCPSLLAIAGLATILAACRVGGPERSPLGLGGSGGTGGDAQAVPATGSDGAAAPEIDAGADGVADPSAGCAPPFSVEICEPVCNTGCAALLRCDVSDVPHTGTCVGIWITQEGAACFKGAGTDACAVGLTCLEGKCARLCYRDADCSSGTCCTHELTGPAGATGFRTCASCR